MTAKTQHPCAQRKKYNHCFAAESHYIISLLKQHTLQLDIGHLNRMEAHRRRTAPNERGHSTRTRPSSLLEDNSTAHLSNHPRRHPHPSPLIRTLPLITLLLALLLIPASLAGSPPAPYLRAPAADVKLNTTGPLKIVGGTQVSSVTQYPWIASIRGVYLWVFCFIRWGRTGDELEDGTVLTVPYFRFVSVPRDVSPLPTDAAAR